MCRAKFVDHTLPPNWALATLTDTDASTGSDTITANARDSFGNVAATQTIGVTISPLVPVLSAPGSISLTQGNAGSIAGVSLSEANNVPGEIFIVSLSDSAGVLSASTAGSASVNQFNGPQEVTISGTLNQVNAALATLTDTDASTGSDTITANASDSFGNVAATQTIGVTISPLVPVLAAPGSRLVAGISCAAS